MPTLAFVSGTVLLLAVLQDAFEAMLLPRRVERRLRLTRHYFAQTWTLLSFLARRLRPGARREGLLSAYGPFAMVLLFAIWATGLILGCGLIQWALHAGAGDKALTLPQALYLSGVTFFTVGYGDVSPHTAVSGGLAVVEGGTGLGFIAVVIGYLPVLYQLFSRREAHVVGLDARAGSPPTAVGMVVRHARGGDVAQLDTVLREWETWGAELLEGQLSYLMLAFYRSQREGQSWLGALACVMDACALVLVGVEAIPPLQARMTFTMARQLIVQMADAFGVRPESFEDVERLDAAGYAALTKALGEVGVDWPEGDGAREALAELRGTYEPLLAGVAAFLLVPLPGWLPDADAQDHWTRGYRGALTRRIVEGLSLRAAGDDERRGEASPSTARASVGSRSVGVRRRADAPS